VLGPVIYILDYEKKKTILILIEGSVDGANKCAEKAFGTGYGSCVADWSGWQINK
jgi:hypothetical protein